MCMRGFLFVVWSSLVWFGLIMPVSIHSVALGLQRFLRGGTDGPLPGESF